jgi:Chaperone of endosialidase
MVIAGSAQNWIADNAPRQFTLKESNMTTIRLIKSNCRTLPWHGWLLPSLTLAVAWLALAPAARAVVPAPDGGYPGGNTAEGQNALLSLTTGGFNTGVGFLSLSSNTTGSFNTGVGAGTLLANVGAGNGAGSQNTATGAGALLSNSTGADNTANGAFALFSNTTGVDNTATGSQALKSNTTGRDNTANGLNALLNNDTGDDNTANGVSALFSNTTGNGNTAIGYFAGINQTTGFNNVYIGNQMTGVAGESNACYVKSIFGQTTASGVPVFINSNNKLGTITSSKRFKEDIKPMDKASEALFALNPVTFRYKKEVDATATPQLGLVAEDVEKVNPDLVVRDQEGKPYSVRYDQVNAMLLNEFLKEHRKVQKLETNDAEQQREIEALVATVKEQAAQIQKVSAQLAAASPSRGGLEATKPAPVVVNNP